MKRVYVKPMLAVEHYSLTQAIAGCSGIKIQGTGSREDVLADPDSTDKMLDFANAFGFLRSGGCLRPMDGYVEESGSDDGNTVCYHGPIVTAFPS